jgi:glycerol-3-phosphate O-acyltransferase
MRRVLRACAADPRPAPPDRSRQAPQEALRQRRGHLAGLVACRRAWAAVLLAAVTGPLHRRLRHVDVDQASLREVRKRAGSDPLVFLPAHRCYGDSLVLAAVLREAGIARPWRLAGQNLAFWPLGPLARRTGTIFIRREFGLDPGYHAAVRCYLADLLARGQSLEWYPEAGRSRTGRLRRLRTGMLRLLVAAYADSGVADAHVVPVSVVYDATPDMAAVTAQDAGAAKPPEGIRGLIRYLRAGRTLGPRHAWVAFGEPVSLRDLTRETAGEWDATRALAKRIATGLREATHVTAESLLALVIASDGEPLRAADLARRVEALRQHATSRGTPLRRPVPLEPALDGLIRARVLSRGDAGISVLPGREPLLAYHRNVVEHWFMPRAAAELVATGALTAHRAARLLAPLDATQTSNPDTLARLVDAELAALRQGWHRQPFLLAPGLLTPVFGAYRDAVLDSASPARSAELRGAALAVLSAEGFVDEAAKTTFVHELDSLLTRLRIMAEVEAARHIGTADVRG